MIDERILLIIIPAVFFWCLKIPSHRRKSIESGRMKVVRIIALLAGSKTQYVDQRAFSFQLGDLSMTFWYIILVLSNVNYLAANAYVFGILLGAMTGLLLQTILKTFAR